MQKMDACGIVSRFGANTLFRQSQHPRACIEAIDLNVRISAKQLAEKPAIPLAHDQDPARRLDLAETGNATTLKIIPERDPLQSTVPGRDGVEAHAFVISSASKGVSRTRSARAVRRSVPIVAGNISRRASKSALRPMQPKTIAVSR